METDVVLSAAEILERKDAKQVCLCPRTLLCRNTQIGTHVRVQTHTRARTHTHTHTHSHTLQRERAEAREREKEKRGKEVEKDKETVGEVDKAKVKGGGASKKKEEKKEKADVVNLPLPPVRELTEQEKQSLGGRIYTLLLPTHSQRTGKITGTLRILFQNLKIKP